MTSEQLWQAQQLVLRSWWSWRPGCGCVHVKEQRTGRVTAVTKGGIFVQMDNDPEIGTGNAICQRLATPTQFLVPNLADPTGATQGILHRMLHDFVGGELPPEHQNILAEAHTANIWALLSLHELPA